MQASVLPVFDSAQLARQSHGDSALQVELLALFVTEAERLMQQLEAAPDRQIMADRLHALRGLARNVGAARLAQAAHVSETQMVADAPNLEPLRIALGETLAYVRQIGI
jgi:HPt (histidine-containing phosphotransfer) domain-containing protein